MQTNWEPKILAFLCNWCSYAGADLAGTSRIQYSPNIRVIRVPCSGRINPLFILKALQSGIDGVLVSGCHPGIAIILVGIISEEGSQPLSRDSSNSSALRKVGSSSPGFLQQKEEDSLRLWMRSPRTSRSWDRAKDLSKKESREFGVQSSESRNGILKKNLRTPN